MSVDTRYLLYGMVMFFQGQTNVKISKESKDYAAKKKIRFMKLTKGSKTYYLNYSTELATKLISKLGKIKMYEINMDKDDDKDKDKSSKSPVHDFRLITEKNKTHYISLNKESLGIYNINPRNLMKVCKYNGNTNMAKAYNAAYDKLNTRIYSKTHNKVDRYNEISAKSKDQLIFSPMTQLMLDAISKKRKCAANLYSHLVREDSRLIVYIYRNKFSVYDTSKLSKIGSVESFSIKRITPTALRIKFNNGVILRLELKLNSTLVQKNVSLKYIAKFTNAAELMQVVENTSV